MTKPEPCRYRTTNWSSYNAAPQKRGSLLIWLAPHEGRPRRPAVFSNAAIQFCLSIKVLFKLPLRQTIGMAASSRFVQQSRFAYETRLRWVSTER